MPRRRREAIDTSREYPEHPQHRKARLAVAKARQLAIYREWRDTGYPLRVIGDRWGGISRQRVAQIIAKVKQDHDTTHTEDA